MPGELVAHEDFKCDLGNVMWEGRSRGLDGTIVEALASQAKTPN